MKLEVPEYYGYRCKTAPVDVEEDELPNHFRSMPLPQFLDAIPKNTIVKHGAFILFDIDGYFREDLYMEIYYRTPWDHPGYFPIIRISLEGKVIEDMHDEIWADLKERMSNSKARKGTMHGLGAFRKLMQYLERELPGRGFKGIFMECVHNEYLTDAALRYGFELIYDPKTRQPTKNLRKDFALG